MNFDTLWLNKNCGSQRGSEVVVVIVLKVGWKVRKVLWMSVGGETARL